MKVSSECLEFDDWTTISQSFTLSSETACPFILSDPVTKRFELMVPPKKIHESYIDSKECIKFRVVFHPPLKDEDDYLWDNFQDRIVIHQSPSDFIELVLRSFKDQSTKQEDENAAVFYPRRLPSIKHPTKRMFDIINIPVVEDTNQQDVPTSENIATPRTIDLSQHALSKQDAASVIRNLRSLHSTRRSVSQQDPSASTTTVSDFKLLIERSKTTNVVSEKEEEQQFYKRFLSAKNASAEPERGRRRRPMLNKVDRRHEKAEKYSSAESESSEGEGDEEQDHRYQMDDSDMAMDRLSDDDDVERRLTSSIC